MAPRTRQFAPSLTMALACALIVLTAPAVVGAQPAPAPSAIDSLLARATLDPRLLEAAVLERNPTLAATRAAFEESKARGEQMGALMNPMLEGMVAPRGLGNEMGAPGYVIGLSQVFPLFGERGLERKAGRAEARAMGEDFRSMRLDLLQESRRLYYEYFLVERGAEVNQELKGFLEQMRAVAVQKYAAGVVGRQDALQAEAELAMLDHDAIVLGRERRIVRARLNALLHREPAEALPAPEDSIPAAREDDTPAVLSDLALARPDVRRASAERDMRAAQLSLARRRRLPEFTFLARYDGMEEDPDMRPMVGAGLSLPLWFGRIGESVREAEAGLERKEQERLAAIDKARFEIEEARAKAEETRHEIHVIETGVLPATERALVSIRAAYEANRSDFLALLNAERDLSRARLGWHRARADYRMALADWQRAIAKDDVPLPEEPR